MTNQPSNQYQWGITNPYVTPPGFTTQATNHPVVQPTPVSPFAHRSLSLLGFGIFDVVISVNMFIWSLIVAFRWSTSISNFVTMPCAIFHLILGIVSILGARDGIRYRGCLIASLVMGIVGPCVFVCATLTTDIIEWVSRTSYNKTVCTTHTCYTNEAAIFGAIIAYSVIQAIVSVVLSSISCCNLCQCCGCCYTGEPSQQPLLYAASAPPPYVDLAVPQTVPHNVPTFSGGTNPTFVTGQ